MSHTFDERGAVSLPWYSFAEVQDLHGGLFAALRPFFVGRGVRPSARLVRDKSADALLLDPTLLMSQTCGSVVGAAARGAISPSLAVVGTPCYAVSGVQGPHYQSAVVVRRDVPARSMGELRELPAVPRVRFALGRRQRGPTSS